MNGAVIFIPLVFVVGALVFWALMFRDLWANPELPVDVPSGLSWPPESKNAWTVVFVLLNVFGALFYYFAVYRDQP